MNSIAFFILENEPMLQMKRRAIYNKNFAVDLPKKTPHSFSIPGEEGVVSIVILLLFVQ